MVLILRIIANPAAGFSIYQGREFSNSINSDRNEWHDHTCPKWVKTFGKELCVRKSGHKVRVNGLDT